VRLPLIAFALIVLAVAPGSVLANTSHAGWPRITGVLLMNKLDQSRPLDARPGHDPFGGVDATYSCDGLHHSNSCVVFGPPVTPDPAACLPVPEPPVPSEPAPSAEVPGPVVAPADIPATGSPADPGPATSSRAVARAVVPDCPVPDGRGAARLARDGHNELLGGHGNNVIHAGPHGDVIWGDYKPRGDPLTQVNHLYGGRGKDFIYAAHGSNYIWTGGGRDVVHAHFGRGAIHCQSPTVTVYLSHLNRHRYRLFGCRHISYRTLGY